MSFACRPLLLLLALGVVMVPRAGAVTLADEANFRVKNTFSGDSLSVPRPLGGLSFSVDGSVLYVVGASESLTSALYAVPVHRDPVTNEVLSLGPASAVTKVFDGDSSIPGLDAGIEFGPAGTLFYTYWRSNWLGERPGGTAGAESVYDMADVGVPASIAGLTFSPHRIDPHTNFGQMQVSSWPGNNLYEVPLTVAGGGLFTPGPAVLFVTLPNDGTGAIQYIPSGTLAGNLMYVNYSVGQIRLLTIDKETGLPIDQDTQLPTLGTTNPVDTLFASDLGIGPWGLEFDPLTNDFFVATFNGSPLNSIIQIGGTGFPPPIPTTSTTIVGTSTTVTTTTSPASACGNGQVDAAAGEQCDLGPANGSSGSCCNAACRLTPAGSVCRTVAVGCEADAVCTGADATCPANGMKADDELCDDANPATGTSACHAGVCQGVSVSVRIAPEIDVPAGTKQVAIPVAIEVEQGGGPAQVVVQGFTDCDDVAPVATDCNTRTCRLIRSAQAASCPSTTAATTLAAGRSTIPGKLLTTGKLVKKVARRKRTAQGRLRLNKLGRALFSQNAALPLEARTEIRDRGSSTLTVLFRILLQRL